ncbi:MAG: hypothetical protein F6K16_22955 [Symploca sp. SIO2B6]|nr:hypothetical protein [Symploca sp. SIO2B6]
MHRLEEQQTVPMVKAKSFLIAEIQAETWWTDITPVMIDHIRRQLRDLIKFIDQKAQKLVYTNFIDKLGTVEIVNVPVQQTGFSPYQYRQKIEAYIRENEDHIAVAKLKRNLPLTDGGLASLEAMLFESEVIESREKFQEVYSKDLSLKRFIRELVGLDRNAAKQAFAQYLENTSFSANQIRFVETIIDYLTQQGIMDAGLLYEPPFTDLHHEGLDGVFDDDHAEEIINIIESFNKTIGVNFGAASRSRQESDQFSSQLLC